MKTLVIAGTHDQGLNWAKNECADRWMLGKTGSLSDFIFVSSIDQIRGMSDPSGVFVGTWIERTDLAGIFQQLLMSIPISDKKHRIITQTWGKWKDYHETRSR